ncbi:MAG: aldehyde dehydrogenase family protein, partial [Methanomassiliicoccales archaeon]|nr:aldehyde dehydrogenase family protein [Methanomassiliicoccales archaeon]
MIVVSLDPRTGDEVARFRSTKLADVRAAVTRARTGQARWWRQESKLGRIETLRRVEEALLRNKGHLVDGAALETGLPKSAVSSGLDSAMRGFSYYTTRYEALNDIDFPLDPKVWKDMRARVVFEPHGVVGQIGVWN